MMSLTKAEGRGGGGRGKLGGGKTTGEDKKKEDLYLPRREKRISKEKWDGKQNLENLYRKTKGGRRGGGTKSILEREKR